ncbi:unnamed protein product [Soboliphyme baturini]|uniref:G_PROTEIN_RECEP_F1_2 domain-containing protein n=1 Tax=Soboliphyme baturini TaxID=241478 RepID=A0A183JA56_9BILA|nr:unnamed protein product [Soboliphyme baturini]
MNGNASDDSDMSLSAGLHQLGQAELAVWFILYGLIASLSISGNLLVLYVFYSCSRLRTITNYFIINLAVADMVTGMLAIPFKFQAALLQQWFLPSFLCSLVPFIETMSLSVSVFTLSASAVDRLRAISLKNRKALSECSAKLLLVVIWMVSIAFSLPYGIGHNVFDFPTGPNSSVHVCLPIHEEQTWWKAYNVYLTIIQYFVPLVIINCAYCFIGYQIWLTKPVMKVSDQSFEKSKRTVRIFRTTYLNNVQKQNHCKIYCLTPLSFPWTAFALR